MVAVPDILCCYSDCYLDSDAGEDEGEAKSSQDHRLRRVRVGEATKITPVSG